MGARTLVRGACGLVLLVPLLVTSTPPSRPPVTSYRIRGQILDSGRNPLENAPVTLAARCGIDGFVLLRAGRTDCGYVLDDQGIPAALTDVDGAFYLDVVSSSGWFDSLAVAVVYPDTFLMGQPFSIHSATNAFPLTESVPHVNDGSFCTSSIEYTDQTTGYVYSFSPDTLVLGIPAATSHP